MDNERKSKKSMVLAQFDDNNDDDTLKIILI